MPDRDTGNPTPAAREASRAAAKRVDRVNDWLFVGGALAGEELQRLLHAGVTHVVDLRAEAPAEDSGLESLGIKRRHVPVPDRSPPSMEQLVETGDWLGNHGASVYVHCKGGFGRAATMAVALLVLRGHALSDAVDRVREARPEMRLNAEQLAWLSVVEQRFVTRSPEA
jgi:protein-tyrosine phosphatase